AGMPLRDSTHVGQPALAGQAARDRASRPVPGAAFVPGRAGAAAREQALLDGVDLRLPTAGSAVRREVLPASGGAALGVKNAACWSPDLDNETNEELVEDFKAKFGRIPSVYAAQAFDTANLILSAVGKASVKDKEAFRAALKEAD